MGNASLLQNMATLWGWQKTQFQNMNKTLKGGGEGRKPLISPPGIGSSGFWPQNFCPGSSVAGSCPSSRLDGASTAPRLTFLSFFSFISFYSLYIVSLSLLSVSSSSLVSWSLSLLASPPWTRISGWLPHGCKSEDAWQHFNCNTSFFLLIIIFPLNKIPSLCDITAQPFWHLLKGTVWEGEESLKPSPLCMIGVPNGTRKMRPLNRAVPCSGHPSGSPSRDVAGCAWGQRWPQASMAGRCSSAGWQLASPRRALGSRMRRWQSLLWRK